MSKGVAAKAPVLSVVLNWNGKRTLVDTIDDLLAQTVSPHHILVIDNGSTDGSERLVEGRERVSVYKLPKNLGFARGNNALFDWDGKPGFNWRAGWLFISNNDVRYPVDAIERLRDAGDATLDAVSVSPWIAFAEPSVQLWYDGGMVIPWFGLGSNYNWKHLINGRRYAGEEDGAVVNADFASGCSVLVPGEYFHTVGGFDCEYPLYVEDFVLSDNLRKQYSGKCYVVRKVLAFHRVSASSKLGSTKKYELRTAAFARWICHQSILKRLPGLLFLLFWSSLFGAASVHRFSGMRAAMRGWWIGVKRGKRPIPWENA
ncbi:MAG: glycosyltransferase family 2 protein [bacterium]|nr:glycosyltransferase family 2 protein [bacterium]